jgi:hypothetical protein
MQLRYESPDVVNLQLVEGSRAGALEQRRDVATVAFERVRREPALVREVFEVPVEQRS